MRRLPALAALPLAAWVLATGCSEQVTDPVTITDGIYGYTFDDAIWGRPRAGVTVQVFDRAPVGLYAQWPAGAAPTPIGEAVSRGENGFYEIAFTASAAPYWACVVGGECTKVRVMQHPHLLNYRGALEGGWDTPPWPGLWGCLEADNECLCRQDDLPVDTGACTNPAVSCCYAREFDPELSYWECRCVVAVDEAQCVSFGTWPIVSGPNGVRVRACPPTAE